MRHVPQRNVQFVARMAPLPFPNECAFLCEIGEVTGGGCGRRGGDRAVLAGTHTALESFRSFLEHPQQCFFLPFVKLPADEVEQSCLVDKEFDECKRAPLSFNRCTGEPREPLSDLVVFIRGFERSIIARAAGKDRCPERDEGRLSQTLPQGFFRDRAADAPIAVFKRDGSIRNRGERPLP